MLKFMDFHPLAIIFILSEGTDVSKFMREFKTAYTIDGWHEFQAWQLILEWDVPAKDGF